MGGDPYAGLLDELRDDARAILPPAPCLGTVMAAENGLLSVQTNGMLLDNDDLKVNEILSWDYIEQAKATFYQQGGKVSLNVNQEIPCHTSMCDLAAVHTKIELTEIPGTLAGTVEVILTHRRLRRGDRVLLIPDQEGQVYTIVCKVVDANDAVSFTAGS